MIHMTLKVEFVLWIIWLYERSTTLNVVQTLSAAMYSRVACPELGWKIKNSQLKGLTFSNWISIASGGLQFYIVHVHLESQFKQNFFSQMKPCLCMLNHWQFDITKRLITPNDPWTLSPIVQFVIYLVES